MGKLSYLISIVVTLLIGVYFYIACCSSCTAVPFGDNGAVETQAAAPETPKVTSYPFAFSDGGYTYNVTDNFNFTISSADYIEPLSRKVRDGIVPGLKNHLTENENKVVNIVGFYRKDEENLTAFPNLGLARANSDNLNRICSRTETFTEARSDIVSKKWMPGPRPKSRHWAKR